MTRITARGGLTAHPTCGTRPRPPSIGPRPQSLEITHAFRLRTKLAAAEPGRPWVINVWGIGYRLCNSEVRR